MKVSEQQLQDLLELTAIDVLLARYRAQLDSLKTNPALEALEQKLLVASAALLDAKNHHDSLESEMKRVDADLEVVLARIKRDEVALAAATNPKDASGLEHELGTLARRKGELEDAELELMEQVASASQTSDAAAVARKLVEEELAKARTDLNGEVTTLTSGIELKAADRAAVAGRLPHELLEIYATRAKRGVPVARLSNRECGGCNMSLTASALGDLTAKAADELVNCPECGAILVR